jgi:3'(2'), 5'-bisphosphate nucleotidase
MLSPPPLVEVSFRSLERLVGIARAAGAAIMPHYGGGGSQSKADGSPLTLADLAADRLIVSALEAWDPSIPIVSEERSAPSYETRRTWSRFWLVDPLDGTKEFLTQNGEFTVNIALIETTRPVLGVVFAPALDKIYFAGEGLGAWRQRGNQPVERLYSAPPPPDAPVRVVASRSHARNEDLALLGGRRVAGQVPMGSSLKFCCLAESTADVYPRAGPVMEWDVAAGDCVFRCSGGDDGRASPLRYNGRDLRVVGFVLGLEDGPLRTASERSSE